MVQVQTNLNCTITLTSGPSKSFSHLIASFSHLIAVHAHLSFKITSPEMTEHLVINQQPTLGLREATHVESFWTIPSLSSSYWTASHDYIQTYIPWRLLTRPTTQNLTWSQSSPFANRRKREREREQMCTQPNNEKQRNISTICPITSHHPLPWDQSSDKSTSWSSSRKDCLRFSACL